MCCCASAAPGPFQPWPAAHSSYNLDLTAAAGPAVHAAPAAPAGTSMSSPSACGGLALLLSAMLAEGQVITPARVRRAVENTCLPVGDAGDAAAVLTYGRGLLQVGSDLWGWWVGVGEGWQGEVCTCVYVVGAQDTLHLQPGARLCNCQLPQPSPGAPTGSPSMHWTKALLPLNSIHTRPSTLRRTHAPAHACMHTLSLTS